MGRRCYEQQCGLACTLDLVGERWTLLLIRELLLGPKRYTDLLTRLPGLTTNLLAARLKQLEEDGLVLREQFPPPAPAVVYQLTELGAALEAFVLEGIAWGERFVDTGLAHQDPGWMLLGLKRRYRRAYQLPFELHVDGLPFSVDLLPDSLTLREGVNPRAELYIKGSLAEVREIFYGPAAASAVINRGQVVVEGKIGRWPKLLAAFGLT